MISVLGVPLDINSSFMKGPALAPGMIRKAFHSNSSNYFTESGIDLKDHPGWIDKGDIDFAAGADTAEVISTSVSRLLGRNDKIIALGGDHSITFPLVQSVNSQYQELTIIHLDAHPDLYDNFEDNPHSHASPFARIMENGLAKRLVQVGIRTMNTHQRQQAERFGVEVIEMNSWSDRFRIEVNGPAYLSFDMDVIDPAFAPGLSHYEPGGFTSRQAISMIQNLKGNFVGADIVEYNPTRDVHDVTAMLAAKLFKEILDLMMRV